MSGRVILFGLDGATYTILDDLVDRGVMPFLAQFMASGARGALMSTTPPLTPPAWTTMVTGRTPGHHGISDFLQYETNESRYIRVVSSRQVRCETIWSIVSRQRMRAGCLNFVAHNPAPRINGYVIPGWVPWRWVKKYSHPADLINTLKSRLPSFNVKELAMDFKEEQKAIAGATIEDYEPWIDLHIRRERQWFDVLRHQMINDPCELVGVVFDGVDKLQHLLWHYLDPKIEPAEPSETYLRTRERCWDYFRQLDRFLEETVYLAGPESSVFIVSDHGFTGTNEVLYINTWLERQGYLVWKVGIEVSPEDSQELGEAFPYHSTAFDMAKTRAYASNATSNGIHIPVRGTRGADGVAPGEYESFRRELIDRLLNGCVDPETGERLVKNVWTREEIFAGPMMELTPDLTLALRDDGFFSVLRGDKVLKRRPVVMGTHHPAGVFIGRGPGVREGAALEPLNLVNIAPTILYVLGLPTPEDFEGRIAEEIFTPAYLGARTPRKGPKTEPVSGSRLDGATAGEEEDPQILARLKALGYIE
ncbi:MAG: alkaline phosphatase family protein [Acidobacteria bacterium]|nr:alkaline phosphatase family protein [Acidobacteriota bacterium]